MSKVILDMSMSLDGFIAGPHDEIEPLHDWAFAQPTETGNKILRESMNNIGAVVMGKRTFALIDSPEGWTAPDGTAFRTPVFVLTHHAQPSETKGVTPFTFVNDGIASALAQASAAAQGKDVGLMGAQVAQQYIQAGLVDEIKIHLIPVLLGNGIRLFDHPGATPITLTQTRVIETPGVTHITLRLDAEQKNHD